MSSFGRPGCGPTVAGLFNASAEELNLGAGTDLFKTLLELGATAVDTREKLLGDEGRTRRRYGALFPLEAETLPVIAYVATRVSPVRLDVRA